MENILKNHRFNVFVRIMILLVPLFLLSMLFEQTGLFIILAIIFSALYLLFFRRHIWILLVLAPPSLCVGNLINVPISANWVYEARFAEIFLVIAALSFLLDSYLRRRISSFRVDKISFILYAYLMASILSIFYAVDFRLFVFGLKTAAYSLVSYFLARQLIDSKRKIDWFLSSIALTVAALSLQVYYKFIEMGFSSKFFFERNTILLPIGPLATTAAILALLVPLLLAYYFQLPKERKQKPFIAVAALLGFTAVFLTLGKGATASMLVGLTYLFLKIKRTRVSFVLAGLWFALLSYVLLNPFLSGLFTRVKSTFVDENTRFRVLEYETSWKLFQDHPFFGVGSGQQLYHFKNILNFETAQLVNNFFVQAAIDLGIFGLALVVFLIIAIMARSHKAVKASMKNGGYYLMLLYGFIASLIVSFLNGLVEVTFYALPYAIIFWLLMGVYGNIQSLAKTFDYRK